MTYSVRKRKPEEGKVVLDYLLDNCAKFPNKIFLTQPMGGEVINFTFIEFLSESKKMAAHIESLNLPVPSQIAIMSKNCAWWLMADLAIMMTGHVSVPIYPTLTAETVKYTLEHSESQLLFVGKLDTRLWNEMKKGVPGDMKCISFPLCPDGLAYDKWADLVGKSEEINEVKKRTSTELATIILIHEWEYGSAQGCHDQFENMTTTTLGLNDLMRINQKDRYLSYLPLSHSMERWVGECLPFVTGCHVYYADSLSNFVFDMKRCKPTLFLSVPRLWTKFQEGVFAKMPPPKLGKFLKTPIVSYVVKRQLLKSMGLDCVRFAASGSAPLPLDVLAWYCSLGLELLEGYGMTENLNCKLSTLNRFSGCIDITESIVALTNASLSFQFLILESQEGSVWDMSMSHILVWSSA